jgi:hypothetical protein
MTEFDGRDADTGPASPLSHEGVTSSLSSMQMTIKIKYLI